MKVGNDLFQEQLHELGVETSSPAPGFIAFKFQVPHGRFEGKQISIAVQAPKFPLIPPSGIFVSPHIMPISGGGGNHPEGGIHNQRQPNDEYQYWSRPYKEWNKSSMTVVDYLGFIRTLFDFK